LGANKFEQHSGTAGVRGLEHMNHVILTAKTFEKTGDGEKPFSSKSGTHYIKGDFGKAARKIGNRELGTPNVGQIFSRQNKYAHLDKIQQNCYFFKVRKKILFIITQSEFGGAQRFLSTLIPQLDPERYEVLVATGSTGDEHFSEHLKNLTIANTTLAHLVRNINPWHDIRAVFEIRKLIKDFRPNTLFLLSTKAGFLGSLATRYTLHATRPRVIYRIGGWTFNDPWPWWKKALYRTMERWSARWKDSIVVNNTHDLLQARRLHIRPRKDLLLVHNGLDAYKMKFLSKERAREKLHISSPLVVGTIANFYPSKGLRYFIEAAKTLQYDPRIVFVIVGDGKERPVGNQNVLFAGRIPEASRILPAFDIFVSPSVKEGFQWAVLEAMVAKVPVIATRVGAAPEIIEDGKNGFLVEQRNPEQIAESIKKLIENDHLRQEFAIQGHQTVLFQFGLGTMVSLYVDIIDNTSSN